MRVLLPVFSHSQCRGYFFDATFHADVTRSLHIAYVLTAFNVFVYHADRQFFEEKKEERIMKTLSFHFMLQYENMKIEPEENVVLVHLNGLLLLCLSLFVLFDE
jgi:hypothetical protein